MPAEMRREVEWSDGLLLVATSDTQGLVKHNKLKVMTVCDGMWQCRGKNNAFDASFPDLRTMSKTSEGGRPQTEHSED